MRASKRIRVKGMNCAELWSDCSCDHENYNFLDCDWFKNSYFPRIHSPSCDRTVQQANHIQCLNQQITTLVSITIETVYRAALNNLYLLCQLLNANFPFFQFFLLIGNKTSCPLVRSVITLMINKSDSFCAFVRFCYHLYDYKPNCTSINSITITYYI